MMDLQISFSAIVQSLIMGGISWMAKIVWDIRECLIRQNGRIAKAEQWQEQHAEQCQERHQQNREESRMQWEAIARLQERP